MSPTTQTRTTNTKKSGGKQRPTGKQRGHMDRRTMESQTTYPAQVQIGRDNLIHCNVPSELLEDQKFANLFGIDKNKNIDRNADWVYTNEKTGQKLVLNFGNVPTSQPSTR